MLNGDREVTSNRQSTTTDVTAESSEPKIPVKFKADVETLKAQYPSAFENKHGIVLTLHEALELLPRDRARTDSYKSLQEWLLTNTGGEAVSQIKEVSINNQKEKGKWPRFCYLLRSMIQIRRR